MPTITIKTGEGERCIEFSPGRTLRDILDTTAFRVRSGCSGAGACGLCRVQIMAEEPPEPNATERIHLANGQIASGVRLACQVKPQSDLEVSILSRAPVSCWRALPGPSRAFPGLSSKLPEHRGKPYGVSVDLGTTHISLSFYNLSTGQWFAGRRGLNPQGTYGADVLSRLVSANESEQSAQDLRRLAVEAIGSAIMDVAAREGIGAEEVVKVALVGNTAMLALLSGRNSHLLLDPSYWVRPIDCLPLSPQQLRSEWGIHCEAAIEFPAPLAGFVGSDLLAGVFAARLVENKPGALFIDFGTNSELALWDGASLWVTSAAGGPAFEGCGIGCGSPGEPGAVYRVRMCEPGARTRGDQGPAVFTSNAGLDFELRTIDDEPPRGLCGSGIVDLIACLVESGKLTSIGRFSAGVPDGGIVLLNGGRQPLKVTKRDVDIFQRAKAAISAAAKVLLSKASMSPKELGRVCVGGAFGHFLNRHSAAAVGLVPDLSEDAVEVFGNTALTGCEELLMSPGSAEIIEGLRDKAKLVNLAQCAEFDDYFLEGLYLGRWADCRQDRTLKL